MALNLGTPRRSAGDNMNNLFPRHPDDPFADSDFIWVKRGEPIVLDYIKNSDKREEFYQLNKAFYAKYYAKPNTKNTA